MITGSSGAIKCELPRQVIVFRQSIPEQRDIRVQRSYEIRLPQMANAALSENWLLKEIGDVHWELVSKGLDQKSSRLKNADGDRLCAAFVRVQYSLSPLNQFQENDMLDLQGEIQRLGTSVYLSRINGYSNNNCIKAQLMSCFSAVGQNNKNISKSTPVTTVNYIRQMEEMPAMFAEFRKIKKQCSGMLLSMDHSFELTDHSMDTCHYVINPYYEVNGVGLLYFAAYPFISDQCVLNYLNKKFPGLSFNKNYHTTHRDIFYYANCNVNDRIIHRICSIETTEKDTIKTMTALYRESDGILMAKIFTTKQSAVYESHQLLWSK